MITRTMCPLCGTTLESGGTFFAQDLNQRISSETFLYRKCPACRTQVLVEIPADLKRYYGSAYPAYLEPEDPAVRRFVEQVDQSKMAVLARYASPGARVLEIGPGNGTFLRMATAAGYRMVGIEMDARCCDQLSRVHGLDVHICDDPARKVPELGRFDVVVAWHVLEHILDLSGLLRSARKALLPGGRLLIAVPDPTCFHARMHGSRWRHLDAPRHIHLFPAAALVSACTSLGFVHEATLRDGVLNDALTRSGSIPSKMLARTSLRGIIARMVTRGFFFMRPLIKLVGWEDTYISIFRRVQVSDV